MTAAASADSRRVSLVEGVCVVVLAVALSILAIHLAHPHFIGHDDGVYVATGQSLVEDGSYRLVNLPGCPPQTKYPPAYPLALSLAWLIAPHAPENIPVLKAVNGLLLGALVLAFWSLLRGVYGLDATERILGTAVLATLPGVFSFTDLLISELAFMVVLVAIVRAASMDGAMSRVGAARLGALGGALVLTRTVGMAVVLALVWHTWRRHGARTVLVLLAVLTVTVGPWLAWRAAVTRDDGPLAAFYVAYERSAWADLVHDPGYTRRVVTSNAGEYGAALTHVLGIAGAGTAALWCVAAVVGMVRTPPRRRALVAGVCVAYVVVLLGHPMPMARYVAPLAPLLVLFFVSGVSAARHRLARWLPGVEVLAWAAVAVLVAINLAWLRHMAAGTVVGPQWHFGQRSAIEWSGFEEMFSWIRVHTPADARLASAYDTVYYVHTGRRGIRPWLHVPETYTSTYGRSAPRPSTDVVARELDRLGVTLLIVDPLDPGPEGEHASRTITELLQDPARTWSLAYATADGRHRAYRRGDAGTASDVIGCGGT